MYQFEDIEETIISFDSINCLGTARNFLTDNIQKKKWACGSHFMIVHFEKQSDQLENSYVVKESKLQYQIHKCIIMYVTCISIPLCYRLWRKIKRTNCIFQELAKKPSNQP